jgi:hypothetical protein
VVAVADRHKGAHAAILLALVDCDLHRADADKLTHAVVAIDHGRGGRLTHDPYGRVRIGSLGRDSINIDR